MVICAWPSDDDEFIDEMPAIVESCRSIGAATDDGHRFRAGAGQLRRDLDGRKIHRRQCGDRQQPVGEDAEYDQRRRHQRRQHRAANTGFRDVHGSAAGGFGRAYIDARAVRQQQLPVGHDGFAAAEAGAITTVRSSTARSTLTACTLATPSLMTKTKFPVWLTCTAARRHDHRLFFAQRHVRS